MTQKELKCPKCKISITSCYVDIHHNTEPPSNLNFISQNYIWFINEKLVDSENRCFDMASYCKNEEIKWCKTDKLFYQTFNCPHCSDQFIGTKIVGSEPQKNITNNDVEWFWLHPDLCWNIRKKK